MSTEQEHLALANRNQGTLDYLLLDAAKCSEWIAVVAFYKSLHVAQAIFASEKPVVHTTSHIKTLDRLKRRRRYQLLYPHYRSLWTAALVARYLAADSQTGSPGVYACFEDYLPAGDIRTALLDACLCPFERLAVQLLGQSAATLIRHPPSSGK